MIKFFRKIRYNLMETGKTSRYLKYAIGEIILVVVGILIALQINNWNEGRKQLKKQDFLFEQLLSDAEADSVFFHNRLEGLIVLNSTLNDIRQFGENENYNIAKINTNGTGNVFPMNSFRHNSNLLDNNAEVYKELLDFGIKSQLRSYRAKFEYVLSSYGTLNKAIKDIWADIAKRYYKELRLNKASRSIEAIKVIYRDDALQAITDLIIEASNIARNRTLELLEINQDLIRTLKAKLKNE